MAVLGQKQSQNTHFLLYCLRLVGRDSSVGMATRYGLDGPGIESRCGRDFSHPSRSALRTTQPPVQREKSRRSLTLTTQHHIAPRLKKEWSYTSTPPLGLLGLLQGELYYTDCWGLIYLSCRTLQLTSYDVAVISCKNVDWPDGSTVTPYCRLARWQYCNTVL